ncbi:MAG TPA: bifunctional riboflavin kinase/FAD synthetase [Bryobacteraceae bacterium]|nr:bifunctional riboflavin kinase/FAD synthetase [Bryobacteraceae bacterium]
MSAEIFRTLDEARGRFGPCAAAIGVFDGVHIGHQHLISETVRSARERNVAPAVITFDPHPTAIVAPARVPALLCTLEERLQLLAKAGAERIFVLPFTSEIARLTPEEFVQQILVDALAVQAVLVGTNFNFGYRQSGNTDTLRALGERYGFATKFLDPVVLRGRVVSSTAIRNDLRQGRIAQAGRMLGRCFSIRGPVVRGRGIGSRQTVPTLNLRPDPLLLTPEGIYVTETLEPGTNRRWPSVTSCGYNVTFGATDLTVETYLLSALEDPAPRGIEVRFRHYLRAEQAFPDPASLKAQILRDVARAEAYWRHFDRLARALRNGAPSLY